MSNQTKTAETAADITIVSPATMDIIEDVIYLGGPVTYGGNQLRNLGAKFNIFPIIGEQFYFERYFKTRFGDCEFIRGGNSIKHFAANPADSEAEYELITLEEPTPVGLAQIPDAALRSRWLILSPSCNEFQLDLLKNIGSKTDATLAVDPFGNFGDVEREIFDCITERFDIIKLSEVEAERALGCSGLDAVRNALGSYDKLFLITLADRGTFLYQRGKYDRLIPSIDVQDKFINDIGVGDIFLSSFIHCLNEGREVGQSVFFANVCAALSVDHVGVESPKDADTIWAAFNAAKGVLG